MRNFIQNSNVIHVTAPYTLATGGGCLVGSLFGVATGPVASGAEFDMMTTGVFELAAASAVVAAGGDKAYWDDSAKNITTNTAGVLVGIFAAGKSNGQVVATVAVGVYVAGGSGGASTFAALTDKTTVDLPAVNTPLANALAAKAAADPADGVLTGPYTLTALDNRKTYTCDTALPVSCPNGLSPKPSTIFFPPLTGNLTLTPTGGATLNGSTSPITRAFTGTNKLGVALVPNPYDVNDSIVSGV